jgi:hypothetical protein
VSAADDLRRIAIKGVTNYRALFPGVVDLAHDSIQNGSALTGSPGQPVGQYGPGYHPGKVGGVLKASWQKWYPSPTEAMIATDAPYALQEEEGISYAHGGEPITQRSSVGGFHSRKLTVAAMQRIVDFVTQQVVGENA